MIEKIFYSLVLFPEIQYSKLINSKYFLEEIKEISKWKFKLTFEGKYSRFYIYFKHIDFFEKEKDADKNRTKNWIVWWENKELVDYIISILKQKDIKDFNFFKPKDFYKPIPFGTVLNITTRCNLFCKYCFNDYDYPLDTRNIRKNLWLDDFKTIIDELYEAWTRDVILTWWEPFSSPILWDILDYLRDKGIFIRINTNGTLLFDSTLERLNKNYSLVLMVSMHEFNNRDYFEINKEWAQKIYGISWLKWRENKYEKKVEQLKKIKKYKNLTLDFLTILTPKNILYLERIYDYVLSTFSIKERHFFRLYKTWTTKGISREMMKLAIYKIYKLNKKYWTNFKIVDSVPFCVIKDLDIAAQVIDWELSENHNIKTIITAEWKVQIMSAFDTYIWDIKEKNILEIWQSKFVQDKLNNKYLPNECKDCKYRNQCMWWSRMVANMENWSYKAWDPLWDINNKVLEK